MLFLLRLIPRKSNQPRHEHFLRIIMVCCYSVMLKTGDMWKRLEKTPKEDKIGSKYCHVSQ
jgi:hypothetical protein